MWRARAPCTGMVPTRLTEWTLAYRSMLVARVSRKWGAPAGTHRRASGHRGESVQRGHRM